MQNNRKKELILDAMQKLMKETNTQSISVSDIAREAGIGKGSIYYYFKSKEEILEAVIERAYASAIESSELLLSESEMNALTKMEIIYHTCRNSSIELIKQETDNFFGLQQSALHHQQFINILIKKLRPILADIIRQGNAEQSMSCTSPEEVAEIVLIILTIKIDNHITNDTKSQIQKTMETFADMLETSYGINPGSLSFLWKL